jgi:hypothetical protein
MVSRSFWWGFLGLKSCQLKIDIVWLLSDLFAFLLFLLPVLLLWLGIPRLCWKRVLLQEMFFSRSLFSTILVIALSYIAFIMLRDVPSIPSFIRAFIMRGCWKLLKTFCICWDCWDYGFFLLMLICCIAFNDLCMLNYHCIPGIKPTWSCYIIFSICCSSVFDDILLRIFTSILIKGIGLKFPLFFWLCPCLVWGWV